MKIKHFRAEAVHGHLDFNIPFNDDLYCTPKTGHFWSVS